MAITVDNLHGHFDPARFDAEIESHGTPALWRRAMLCPCIDPDSSQPDPNCTVCRDLPGWVWDDGEPIVVLGPGRDKNEQFSEAGQRVEGGVTITFQSSVLPGRLDRIDFLETRMVVNGERLIRGKVVNGLSFERLRVRPVLSVESVAARIAGEFLRIPVGTDVTFSADGIPTWINPVPDGTIYTVRYVARTAYVVWDPTERDEGGRKQPYKARCQRLDFCRLAPVGE